MCLPCVRMFYPCSAVLRVAHQPFLRRLCLPPLHCSRMVILERDTRRPRPPPSSPLTTSSSRTLFVAAPALSHRKRVLETSPLCRRGRFVAAKSWSVCSLKLVASSSRPSPFLASSCHRKLFDASSCIDHRWFSTPDLSVYVRCGARDISTCNACLPRMPCPCMLPGCVRTRKATACSDQCRVCARRPRQQTNELQLRVKHSMSIPCGAVMSLAYGAS